MKFYTIKLPKVLGSLVRAMLGAFKKADTYLHDTSQIKGGVIFSKKGRPSING